MRIRFRQVLFYGFAGVFIIGGVYLILAARGLVPDRANLTFVKTGAIFLNFEPSDAALVMNNESLRKNARFLGSGVLLDNLPGGTYQLSITKPGFQRWEKTLAVRPGEVTAASYIQLWPTQATGTTLLGDVKSAWLTDAGFLTDNGEGTVRHGQNRLRGSEVILSDPASSAVVTREDGSFFLTDLAEPESVLNISELFSSLRARGTGQAPQQNSGGTDMSDIQTIAWHPFSQGVLLVQTLHGAYLLDTKKIAIEQLASSTSFTAMAVVGSSALFLDAQGELKKINLLLKTQSTSSLGVSTSIDRLAATTNAETVFAQATDGTLYQHSPARGETSLIERNVAFFSLSPEERRLAIAGKDGSLTLLFLREYAGDTRENPGTRVLLVKPSPETFQSVEWMRGFSMYLLARSGNRLVVLEADPRSPHHAYPLASDIHAYTFFDGQLFAVTERNELVSLGTLTE